ncbi:hypothetical protein JOM56_009437 [Amanita muscaria]
MNANTAAGERNCSSRGLSRKHAVVFERDSDTGRIFIKEVKSSDDNGEQLSQEAVEESELFELKNVDIIVSLSASLHCSALNFFLYSTCTSTNGIFNVPGALQRCYTQFPQQGLIGMGGMGGNIRPPGKSRLSFEDIFSRLQGKRKKSKGTGARNLPVLGEIQDSLGSSLNMSPPPHSLPNCPPQVQQPRGREQQPSSSAEVALQDTEASLASQIDKIRPLENILAGHEAFKQEKRYISDIMEARKLRLSRLITGRFDDEDSDEDDAKSVMTVTGRDDKLECTDEEDKECMEHRDIAEEIPEHDLETDEGKHRRRREELRRVKTPKVESLEALFKVTWQEQQTTATVPPPPPPTILITPPPSVEIAKEKEAET